MPGFDDLLFLENGKRNLGEKNMDFAFYVGQSVKLFLKLILFQKETQKICQKLVGM